MYQCAINISPGWKKIHEIVKKYRRGSRTHPEAEPKLLQFIGGGKNAKSRSKLAAIRTEIRGCTNLG